MQIYVPHTHTQTHTHLERLLFSMSFRTSDSKYFKPSSLNRKRLWMVSSMMPNTCFCASSNMSGGGRKHSNEAQDTQMKRKTLQTHGTAYSQYQLTWPQLHMAQPTVSTSSHGHSSRHMAQPTVSTSSHGHSTRGIWVAG